MKKTRALIGRPPAKDRPPGATRASLIQAAAEVFAERGYAGAGIDAIAERAGVTGGAFYKHFPSKAELLLEVVEQALHALPLAEQLSSEGAESAKFFGQLVSIYAQPEMRRLRRLAIEIHAAASRDAEAARLLLEFNRRIHRGVSDRLRSAIAQRLLPPELDIERTASLLLVLVMGMAHLDTLDPELLGDRAFTRFLERSVLKLLATP